MSGGAGEADRSSGRAESLSRSVYVVGAGRVGMALAGLLARRPEAGYSLIGLWSLTQQEAALATKEVGTPCAHGPFPEEISRAEIVIISVTDPAVPQVAAALLGAGLLTHCRVVLHCGGFRPAAEALECIASHVAVGTLHPLLSVAGSEQAARLIPGCYIGTEGDAPAVEAARGMCRALGARSFDLPGGEGMGLYHAAAVMASNHAVALWNASRDLMVEAGLSPEPALEMLLPLVRSTLENLESVGLPEALTGPVARGDVATVARQIALLEKHDPTLLRLYMAGTEAAVRAAPGLPQEKRQAIRALLEEG